MRRRRRLALAALLLVAGCAGPGAPAPQAAACLLPLQQPMVVAELFFGRAIAGRAPLTEVEWAEFAADTIAANFPDGFTVFDGEGRWRNPRTGRIASERTKILLVAVRPDATLAGRLSAVIEAYKSRFRQQSVGIVTRDACAAF